MTLTVAESFQIAKELSEGESSAEAVKENDVVRSLIFNYLSIRKSRGWLLFIGLIMLTLGK